MSATDHTIKLGLPLFRDDDKPTWRGDINDMSQRVDDGYTRLETDISTAANTASAALNLATRVDESVTETATEVATSISTAAVQGVESDIASVRSEMDAFIAAHADDGERSYVDAVKDIGLRNDGSRDCGAPLQNYIDTHPDGAFIFFRPGTYAFDSPVRLVHATTTAPWTFIGSGAQEIGTDDDAPGASDSNVTTRGGTVFQNGVSTGSGMFVFNHEGRFVCEGVQFRAVQPGMKPFIHIDGTVCNIRNCSFRGPVSSVHDSAQVGIEFGTYATYTFGGYGTVVRDCSFDRVGRALAIYNGANGLRIDNVLGSSKCGSSETNSAFIYMDGTGGILKQVMISNVILESHAYKYGVYAKNIDKCVFENVQCWDNSWMSPRRFTHAVYFEGVTVTACTVINPLAEDADVIGSSQGGSRWAVHRNRVIGPDFSSLQFVWSTDKPPFPCLGLDVNDGGRLKVWDGEAWRPFTADDHT